MKETILVVASHSDDQVIGAGGTIARYTAEGKRVIVLVMTSGENSSPWLKKEVIKEERVKESIVIDKYLGCEETLFLMLPDGKVKELIKNKKVILEVVRIINKYEPSIILTHSKMDPHPDHQGTHDAVIKALDIADKKRKIIVYTFEVWNIVNETHPRIYVDVSKTFGKKIRAMKMFKTQRISVYTLLTHVIIRAFFSGFHTKSRYAERFYKVR